MPNEPKCNTHIHINTRVLSTDVNKKKERKKKREKKRKALAFFQRSTVTSLRWKKIWKQFLEEKGKKKGKVRNSLMFYTHRLYTKTQIRTRSLENAWRSNTERHTRWPSQSIFRRQSQLNQSFQFLLFNALPRRRCLRNATTSVVYRAYSIHSLVHPRNHPSFFEQEFTRQYDTPTIVLFFGHCSTVFDAHKR